jgi:isoamyl acetate esterase
MALRPKWILFGDSITQRAFGPGGWASALAHAFTRRVDVINRGYSGYNTKLALHILPYVFPPPHTTSHHAHFHDATDPHLVTIFFGANDAALEERTSSSQHVPLGDYVANLRSIIAHIRPTTATAPLPRIVLITPPPVCEASRVRYIEKTYGVALEHPERENLVTGRYAAACVALAEELGVACVDLYTQFQLRSGWQEALLEDGLHLSVQGNELAGRLILEGITRAYPNLLNEDGGGGSVTMDLPDWKELVNATDVAAAVRDFRQRNGLA